MISSQRQHVILSRLRTRGAVRIKALSEELGVSSMTIRRDITELADKGLLKRVHGGAVTTSTLLAEPLFAVKSQMEIGLKDTIANAAIRYVGPGDVIAIGGGTTAYVFAQHLLESDNASGITILTNSIPVAELVQAMENKDVEVIVTGGVLTRSNALVGPIADKVISSLRVNTLFLGTHSVSMPRGFLTPNSLESATDAALISIADRSIVLADHTKWENTSLSMFASFADIDVLVTDDGLSSDLAHRAQELVHTLVLAPQSGADPLPAAVRSAGAATHVTSHSSAMGTSSASYGMYGVASASASGRLAPNARTTRTDTTMRRQRPEVSRFTEFGEDYE